MLFALAFLPMFGIGGLTGLPLGFNESDVHLHDTYYVIAHFHYVVAPGTIFALFAGIYYWFPKITGRKMNEFWGRVHFWCSLIFMNLVFMPMFAQGMAGMLRRMSDGGANYSAAVNEPERRGCHRRFKPVHHGAARLDFVGRDFAGRRADSLHHQSVLEHQTRRKSRRQSVAGHDAGMADAHAAAARQFRHAAACLSRALRIQRARPCHGFHAAKRTGSFPGDAQYFTRSHRALNFFMEIPYTVHARPDTGLYNAKVGIWLFLASEVMLFGGLFSAYVLLRVGAAAGTWPHGWQNVTLGTINTLVLALSAVTTLMAWVACKVRQFGKFKFFHGCTLLLAMGFVVIHMTEYHDDLTHYEIHLTNGKIRRRPHGGK